MKKRVMTFLLGLFTVIATVFNTAVMPVLADDEPSISIQLRYGDNTLAGGKENESYVTTAQAMGYVELETHYYDDDVENVEVVLSMPATYVQDGTLGFEPFTSNSNTQLMIDSAVKEGDEYNVYIHIAKFDKTQTIRLKFFFNFIAKQVPTNYQLPVDAVVRYGDDQSAQTTPLIYVPEYEDYQIRKYLNHNEVEQNSNNNLEVAVTLGENETIAEGTVTYAFKVFPPTNQNYARDLSAITLTDQLPEGATLTDGNEGWSSEERDGVIYATKTYTGDSYTDIIEKIAADRITLDVSGMSVTASGTEFNFYTRSITNNVSFEAIPKGQGEGEPTLKGSDDIYTTLTTRASGQGATAKYVYPGQINDTTTDRAAQIKWIVVIRNASNVPAEHVLLNDYNSGNGERGLDERLKFTKLESTYKEDNIYLTDGKTPRDIVDYVWAHYTDGSEQRYYESDLNYDASGDFNVTFDTSKECDGYIVYFKDDYQMMLNESFRVNAYSVFRNPTVSHFDSENDMNNRYWNYAGMQCVFQEGDTTKTYWSTSNVYFMMNEYIENIDISKRTYYNEVTRNSSIGDSFSYMLTLSGALDEAKNYENLRIIDLLPKGIVFENNPNDITCPNGVSSTTYNVYREQTEVIENYMGTGRTAVIFYLNVENLLANWAYHTLNQAFITFRVKIGPNADYGAVTNDVYVVGDNLAEYSGDSGVEDTYDFDGDGQTNDLIAHGSSIAYVTGGSSIYAVEYIEHTDEGDWTQSGYRDDLGKTFNYRLRVQNEDADKTGAVIYSVLPQLGDQNIFGSGSRNSELHVTMTGSVQTPSGYTVYYTTSQDVYSNSMEDMVDADIWSTSVGDYADITAIKVVANDGTVIPVHSSLDVIVPVQLPEELSDEQIDQIDADYRETEEFTYFRGIHNFGYFVDGMTSAKQSNSVYVETTDYTAPKMSIPVEKKWIGAATGNVTIQLIQDDVVTNTSLVLNASNQWKDSFKGLSIFNEDGERHTYDIQEVEMDNVTTSIVGNITDGYTVTNTNDETLSIDVEKKWEGDPVESVTFNLLRDGKKIDEAVVTADDHWTTTFSNLRRYDDQDGHEYAYEVEEVEIDGYEMSVEGSAEDGYVFTNKKIPPTPIEVDPPVSKVVDGTPKTQATFTFKLIGEDDGIEKTASVVGSGEIEFGIDPYTEVGTYRYTIYEIDSDLEGYTYDTVVYTYTVVITEENGQLVAEKIIRDQDDNEYDEMIFTNKYEESVVPTPTATPSSTPTVPSVPNTSDHTNLFGWVGVLLLAGGLAGLSRYLLKKSA